MSLGQKIPLAQSISDYVQQAIELNQMSNGLQLPCRVVAVDGAIVTVNFEIDNNGEYTFPQVKMPIAQSIYVRLPVQVGDLGICVSADVRIGGITGLGTKGALAPLVKPFNLSALIFVPVGATDWEAVDPNAVNINAPNGAVIRDTGNNCVITLTPTGVTLVIGSTNITVSGTEVDITANLIKLNGVIQLNGPITQGASTYGTNASLIGPLGVTNDVTAVGKSLSTHVHDVKNVQGGSSTITTTAPD